MPMNNSTLPTLFLSGLVVPFFFLEACIAFDGKNALPWAVIADEVANHAHFCMRLPENEADHGSLSTGSEEDSITPVHYDLKPQKPFAVQLPTTVTSQQFSITIARWQDNAWQTMGPINGSRAGSRMIATCGLPGEGLFRLRITDAKPKASPLLEAYAIAVEDWKRELLCFCQANKAWLEENRDRKLIYSSIAVSHFDHTLNLASSSSFLSEPLLMAVTRAAQAKKAFVEGRCPPMVVDGLTFITLKRFFGASLGRFVLHVPSNYAPAKKWPVYIHVEPWELSNGRYGKRWGCGQSVTHEGMIDLWWHTLSLQDLHWKDYTEVWDLLKQSLAIDDDRIYLYGYCRNGREAMSLALHYPDHWAEANIDVGSSFPQLTGNGMNLAINFTKTIHTGEQLFDTWYDFTVKCFQYFQCPLLRTPPTNEKIPFGEVLPIAKRNRSPAKVYFSTNTLGAAEAYWVQIEGRTNENFPATIQAEVKGQSVLVKTENVDAYRLCLAGSPVSLQHPVHVFENGISLGAVTSSPFVRRPDSYRRARWIKTDRRSGPLDDIYTEPYVVVFGSHGKDMNIIASSRGFAEALANGASCFSDASLTKAVMAAQNVILIGSRESNTWIAQFEDVWPVHVKDGNVLAERTVYQGNIGFGFIYPNPLNPDNYVVVFSGNSATAFKGLRKAHDQLKSLPILDVFLFSAKPNGELQWHIMERWDATWNWQPGWNASLAMVRRSHPRWQYQQWVAHALRVAFKADVCMIQDPFRPVGHALEGNVTSRSLFNAFTDDWFVKIELKGKVLRQLLMLPFTDVTKKRDGLFMDGLAYSRLNDHPEITTVPDLQDENAYTLVAPVSFVQWNQSGVIVTRYRIIEHGYVIHRLKQYLADGKHDLDRELDQSVLTVF